MIPYAILCGKIYEESGRATEIRVLELMADGWTFRLPSGFIDDCGKIARCEMCFFDWNTKAYQGVTIDFSVDGNTLSVVDNTEYYTLYEARTADSLYCELSAMLSKQYMNYIDCKLNLEDAEMSAAMADYPAEKEKDYAVSYEEQIKLFAEELMADKATLDRLRSWSSDSNIEICYSLENRELVSKYLRMHADVFFMSAFKENHLKTHPLATAKIDRIYLGNSFCYNLMPDIENVRLVAEKAMSENMKVSLVIPPIPAHKYKAVCEYIDKAIPMLGPKGEIIANDIGIREYARKHYEASERYDEKKYTDTECCDDLTTGEDRVKNGVLLSKCRKDPRMQYLKDIAPMSSEEQYYPYYQTNTGTFCPLYAASRLGGRGNQERVEICSRECERKSFLYPKHLNMIGKYNSLFGLYTTVMDIDTPRRVVINL